MSLYYGLSPPCATGDDLGIRSNFVSEYFAENTCSYENENGTSISLGELEYDVIARSGLLGATEEYFPKGYYNPVFLKQNYMNVFAKSYA